MRTPQSLQYYEVVDVYMMMMMMIYAHISVQYEVTWVRIDKVTDTVLKSANMEADTL